MSTSPVSASCATTVTSFASSATSTRLPNLDARLREHELDLRDREEALVEDPREEGGVRETLPKQIHRMRGGAEAARCDERPPQPRSKGAIQVELVPGPRAV